MATIGNNYASAKYLASMDDSKKKLDIEEIFANGPQLPREKMPQIDRHLTDDILMHFAKKYKVYKEQLPVNSMKPTQKDYSFGQVKQKVANGVSWSDSPFFVDKDYRLLDGHHRWVQGMMTEPDQKATVYRIAMPYDRAIRILNALKHTYRVMPDGSKVNNTGQYTGEPLSEALLVFLQECYQAGVQDEVKEIVKDRLKKTDEDLNDELKAYADKQQKASQEKPDKSKDNN